MKNLNENFECDAGWIYWKTIWQMIWLKFSTILLIRCEKFLCLSSAHWTANISNWCFKRGSVVGKSHSQIFFQSFSSLPQKFIQSIFSFLASHQFKYIWIRFNRIAPKKECVYDILARILIENIQLTSLNYLY